MSLKIPAPLPRSLVMVTLALVYSLTLSVQPVLALTPTTTADLSLKTSATSVDVAIPSGCTTCRVELRLKGRKTFLRWRTFTLNGKPTSVSVTVPKGLAIDEWRATGTINSARAEAFAKTRKFPDSFYQGKRSFTKVATQGYQTFTSVSGTTPAPLRLSSLVASSTNATVVADKVGSTSTSKTPEITEADIWKTDGSTVYFFNQLRGLQVLDLADPANPKLMSSLRMPAIGQDLYVLPEQTEGERLVVLLTQNYTDSATTDVVVVKVANRSAQEISRSTLPGSLSDSRMLGNRLYVVTTDWTMPYDPIKADETTPAKSNTNLCEFDILADGSQKTGASHPLPNQSSGSLIAAGNDWLAVATSAWNNWTTSQITLFKLDENGASLLTPKPIPTTGRIEDKFKITVQNNVLSAVSVLWKQSTTATEWRSTPVCQLENFDLSGQKLGHLEIISGEQLYATRFTAGKLYAVTFRRVDPLWVIDLSDSSNPKISGHVEVPGYSTYLEPMGENGEFLFTIGWDSSQVVASLFDVSDPSIPALKSRVPIDEGNWGYSEALYNEKALKVLPEDGLALVPFTSGGFPIAVFAAGSNNPSNAPAASAAASESSPSFVQLVDIDLKEASLKLRGRLHHQFEPRRATVFNGVLTSISQKELITANIDNRDQPSVLADVSLAWPVNQTIVAGDYLLQISDGCSAVWSGEPAAVKISKTTSENSILNDVSLGEGSVQEAVLRGSKLYVLRKNWGPYIGMIRFCSGPQQPSASTPQLSLDIYDASNLPELPLLGSAAVAMTNANTNWTISNLHWVTDTLPVVLTQAQPNYYWWMERFPVVYSPLVKSMALSANDALPATSAQIVNQATTAAAVARPFDVSNPKAPVALNPITLVATASTVVSASAAGDGLLVFGYGENLAPYVFKRAYETSGTALTCTNKLGILDFASPSKPLIANPITLPGRLFSVSEVSRSGFLAYTESLTDTTSLPDSGVSVTTDPDTGLKVASLPAPIIPTDSVRAIQASLIADGQAALISSIPIATSAQIATQGRTVYVAASNLVERWSLDDTAKFVVNGSAKTPWTPYSLQTSGSSLLGSNGKQIFRLSWPGLEPVLESWESSWWFNSINTISIGGDRSLYVPMGDYGVERLQAK